MANDDGTLRTFRMINSIIAGMLSLVGSSLLIFTILRSKKKLSIPYRRIIFGICVFDVFQSLGSTTSTFLSPKELHRLSIGNTTTCDIQGLFLTVGAIGVPMYLCSLCTYYFCIIRLNMRKLTFKKIEPYLHAVPILYSLFCGVFALTNQYINNAGLVCYVAPDPITCDIIPDEECTRGEGATQFRLHFLTFPTMAIFVIVCTIMSVITYWVRKLENSRKKYSFPRSTQTSVQLGYQSEASFDGGVEDSHERLSKKKGYQLLGLRIRNAIFFLRSRSSSSSTNNDEGSVHNNIPAEATHSALPTHSVSNRRRRSLRTKDRTTEIGAQAFLYVGSYVISYGFVWTQSLYMVVLKMRPPLAIMVLASIFFPLQGFINMFIYCRPHIVSLQKDFPDEYNWFQAFVRVLKSGGDDPLTPQERRLNSMQMARSRSHHSFKTNNSSNNNNSIEMDNKSGFGLSQDEMSGKRSSTMFTIDSENQSGEESFRRPSYQFKPGYHFDSDYHFKLSKKLDSSESDGGEETNLGIPMGIMDEMAGNENDEMAGNENVMPEVSFLDESSSNCPSSEFDNCRSKSFQPDSREEDLWNGDDSDALHKPPKHANGISTSTTDDGSSENENEVDNGECNCDDVPSVGSVPESLQNIVRGAEQFIDETLDEFLTTAGREENRIDCNDSAEDFDIVTATAASTVTINTPLRNIIDSATTSTTSSTSSHMVDHEETATTDPIAASTTAQRRDDGPMIIDDRDTTIIEEASDA